MQRQLLVAFLIVPSLLGQTKPASSAAGPGAAASNVAGQNAAGQNAAAGSGTRTIQLKFLEPEQLRSIFSGRPYVMEANRELKLLTITGPSAFLDEVEQTGKRFDVAPPLPANIDVTVYLLATAAQVPTAQSLPSELQAIGKTLETAAPAQALRLADTETLRLREGQPGEVSFTESSPSGIRLAHVSLQAAYVNAGGKGDSISLNGLRCWISKASGQTSAEPDVNANIDIVSGQAALVAKAGLEKPMAVIVRSSISR